MTNQLPRASLSQKCFAWFLRRSDDLNHRMYGPRKRDLISQASGHCVELGPGTGVNLNYYAKNVQWTGIEPNPKLHPLIYSQAAKKQQTIRLLCSLDELVQQNKPVDCVVSTLVLCSVRDLQGTLKQIRTLLKPGGTFLFLEHVVDKVNPLRRTIQRVLPFTPWRILSDGCCPGRDIAAAIHQTGFSQVELQQYAQDGPGLVQLINRPHIYGIARR